MEIQHGLDMANHGGLGRRFNRFRIGAASNSHSASVHPFGR